MTIPNVLTGGTTATTWGNAVADRLNTGWMLARFSDISFADAAATTLASVNYPTDMAWQSGVTAMDGGSPAAGSDCDGIRIDTAGIYVIGAAARIRAARTASAVIYC